MKTALIAALFAATLTVPAIAQDTTAQPPMTPGSAPADMSSQPPAGDMSQPAPMTPDASTTAAPQGMTPDSTMTPPAGQAMPADAGAMTPPAAAPMGMASAPAAGDPSTYPPCSRTVKDRCVNREAARKRR